LDKNPFMTQAAVSQDKIEIRDSTDADVARITEIYARSVLNETASFETTPPDKAEMAKRRNERLDKGMPYIVAELDGRVIGYAYAGPFHTRPAYQWTIENTVYVDPAAQRKGVARKLMEKLIEDCTERGFRQMIAVIAVEEKPEDSASIQLHRVLGFVDGGRNRSVGYKHGKWIDTYHLQLSLGDGDTMPPVGRPARKQS
jgi:L-amino acid N-acyltransferase YncA